jgi:hypothetical protein
MKKSDKDIKEIVKNVTKDLIDAGRLIEAGWVGFRMMAVPPDAPRTQLDAMRLAFFAGAQHLFASIMTVLEPEREPTENDLRRMDQIAKELERFKEEFDRGVKK